MVIGTALSRRLRMEVEGSGMSAISLATRGLGGGAFDAARRCVRPTTVSTESSSICRRARFSRSSSVSAASPAAAFSARMRGARARDRHVEFADGAASGLPGPCARPQGGVPGRAIDSVAARRTVSAISREGQSRKVMMFSLSLKRRTRGVGAFDGFIHPHGDRRADAAHAAAQQRHAAAAQLDLRIRAWRSA